MTATDRMRRDGTPRQDRPLRWSGRVARALATVALLMVAACSGTDEQPPKPQGLEFPKGFTFGTAIAGFQGDMGCPTEPAATCEDRNSDWYQWVTSKEINQNKGLYASGDPVSYGPGHWELYASDFALAKKDLAIKGWRMSIEWSRVFPTSTVGVEGYDALKKIADPKALERYHKMFQELRKQGIEPMVTLNHYTLPLWIHDGVACHKDLNACTKKGWLDSKTIVAEIAKYSGFVAQEFGAEVDYWMTLNEPFAVVLPGYLLPTQARVNPPGQSMKLEEGRKVLIAMIEAHARMYDALKKHDTKDADGDGKTTYIGIAYSVAPVFPKDPKNDLDVQGAKNTSYLLNEVFFEAIVNGKLDEGLDGKKKDRPDLARLDFVGINYYEKVVVEGTAGPPIPKLSPLLTINPATLAHEADHPKGIYDAMMLAKKYGKPIIITENGFADDNPADKRQQMLVRHLFWLHKAIADGAKVEGYLFWSFVDNYEWNHGFNMRFGLFGIDPKDPTKKRTARPVASTFKAIAEKGFLSKELLEKYLNAEEKALLAKMLPEVTGQN